jgi:hypothetical protein
MADDLSTKASTSALVPDGVLKRWLRQPIAHTAKQRGRDQYLEAGGPDGLGPMEPAKGHRCHGRLHAS